MLDLASRLAAESLALGSIQLRPAEPFTWASGYRMPIYNDNRKLLSQHRTRRLVIDGFVELIAKENIKPQTIAGVATAGIPHAALLADKLELPLIYVRAKEKDHGMGRKIEGILGAGDDVLVIEDLISTGGSSLQAVVAVREAGGRADCCFSIFSYGFSEAAAEFEKAGCVQRSILTFDRLLEVAREQGRISAAEAGLLAQWSADPFGWGEKNGFPPVKK